MTSLTFTLGSMPVPVDSALLADLVRVETATVGHFRHDGFMHPDLRPLIADRRISGTAVTVAIPGPDSALLHHAMGLVRPGDVLVVDRCGDDRHACWGGYMAAAAKAAGLAGVIIDGRITDPAEIRANGVPVWCRDISPITTKLLALGGHLNVPISCGGVVVRPGDVVLADECGVLVLDPAAVRAVIDKAIAMQEEEAGELAQLRAGVKVPMLTGASEKISAAIEKTE